MLVKCRFMMPCSPSVLLTTGGRAKILADFVLSGQRRQADTLSDGGGSWHWAAPERVCGEHCSLKCDIYSLGVVGSLCLPDYPLSS